MVEECEGLEGARPKLGVEGLVAVGVGPVGSHLVTTAEHLEYGVVVQVKMALAKNCKK